MTQAWDFINANVLWQQRDKILDILIDDMELSIRSVHCLLNANIVTIGELVKLTQYDLMRLPNLGRKSLREIREELANYNLALSGEAVT